MSRTIEELENDVARLEAENYRLRQDHDFMREHLKFWKDSGIPAPENELQSIAAWLSSLGNLGFEKTTDGMRTRMILLMKAANTLYAEGKEAEDAAGIYDNRPDLRPDHDS